MSKRVKDILERTAATAAEAGIAYGIVELSSIKAGWAIPIVAVLAFLIFYFGFQALTGDRGLLALSQRNELLAEKRAELDRIQAQRKDLEARARLVAMK